MRASMDISCVCISIYIYTSIHIHVIYVYIRSVYKDMLFEVFFQQKHAMALGSIVLTLQTVGLGQHVASRDAQMGPGLISGDSRGLDMGPCPDLLLFPSVCFRFLHHF